MHPVDLSPFTAVIFDWDGTVVDSQPLNYAALRDALHPYGVVLDRSWYWQRLGISTPDLLAQLGAEVPAEAVVADCRRRIIAGIETLEMHQPVVDVARRARTAGLRLAVASGGADDVVRAGITATGLADWFDAVVTRADVALGKPAPDLFLKAARRLDVPAGQCLVIEDADEGLAAAAAAGMAVIDVREGLVSPR